MKHLTFQSQTLKPSTLNLLTAAAHRIVAIEVADLNLSQVAACRWPATFAA